MAYREFELRFLAAFVSLHSVASEPMERWRIGSDPDARNASVPSVRVAELEPEAGARSKSPERAASDSPELAWRKWPV